MRILCYNIKAATGIEGGHFAFWNYFRSNEKILDQISKNISDLKPDIIGLIEVDAGSFRSKNQIEYLAKSLGYNYTSACKYGWAASWPAFKNQHLAIISKYDLLDVKKHYFSKGFKRLALEAVLWAGKEKISAIVTHLSLGKNAREQQLAELTDIIKKIKHKVIVLGDFNGENIALDNLYCATGKTFPSWKPQKQFDYIFSNCKIKNSKVLSWQLSDHLSLYAEI